MSELARNHEELSSDGQGADKAPKESVAESGTRERLGGLFNTAPEESESHKDATSSRADEQVQRALERLKAGESVTADQLLGLDLFMGKDVTSQKVEDAMMDTRALSEQMRKKLGEARDLYATMDNKDMVTKLDQLISNLG